MVVDLGKKFVQGGGEADGFRESGALAVGRDIPRRILETNTVRGTVRAQKLDRGSREVGFELGHIDLLVGFELHFILLISDERDTTQAGPAIRMGRTATVCERARPQPAKVTVLLVGDIVYSVNITQYKLPICTGNRRRNSAASCRS